MKTVMVQKKWVSRGGCRARLLCCHDMTHLSCVVRVKQTSGAPTTTRRVGVVCGRYKSGRAAPGEGQGSRSDGGGSVGVLGRSGGEGGGYLRGL